jgi:hypothetical protein
MATYYWVGGAGNWTPSVTTNWSATSGGAGGAGYPTTADDVIFDQAGPYTVTVFKSSGGVAPSCKNLTVTGANVTFSCTTAPYAPQITVAGAFVLAATTTFVSVTQALTIYLQSPLNNTALTLNGAVFNFGVGFRINCPATFNNGYLLGSAFTGADTTLNVDQGTFNTGGYAVDIYTMQALDTTLYPSFVFSNSFITLKYLNIQSGGRASLGAGTSSVSVQRDVYIGSSLALYNLTLTPYSSGALKSLRVTTVNQLTIPALDFYGIEKISLEANITITSTLNIPGYSFGGYIYAAARVQFFSSSSTTARTVTVNGAFQLRNVDFHRITAAGSAGTWSGTNLGNALNNTNITFPAGVNKYWNQAAGGYFRDVAWTTTSGGTPAVDVFPLAQDTVVFEATGLNSGATITWSGNYYIGTMDMSARTSNTMTLDLSYDDLSVFGNWINGSGTTITTVAGDPVQTEFLFLGQTTQTITTANISFGNTAIIVGVSSTLTLVGNLSVSGSNLTQISLNSSSVLDLNGYTFSCAVIYTDASTIVFNGGTLELTGSGIVSDFPGSLTTTPGTGAGTINLTSASAKTFAGNNQNFNCTLNQGGSGQLTVTGSNTFTNITNSVSPATVLFAPSTTNIFTDFSLAGTAGNLVTVGSTSSTRTDLSKTSGVVSGNFLSISNTNAVGGATWYAVNSTNGGNNSGWQFAASDSGMMLWF